MGVPTRIFVVLMTETKKLVADIALIWEDHTVVGVLIFLPVYAKAPVETTHNSQVSKKNEDVPILAHPLQFI